MATLTRDELEKLCEPTLPRGSASLNPCFGDAYYYNSLIDKYGEKAVEKARKEYLEKAGTSTRDDADTYQNHVIEKSDNDNQPLATRFRPKALDDVVGQTKPKAIIGRMLETDTLTSMIFFGSPGCGKTTMARIIADSVTRPMLSFNATTASMTEVKKAIADADSTPLVYLDEIQYWNKKQQQSLLALVEDGAITLIAATTENPWHGIYKALLSRLMVIEFERVRPADVRARLDAVLDELNCNRFDSEALTRISEACAGDVRRALNLLEMALNAYPEPETITEDMVRELVPSMNMSDFDDAGDAHYTLVSALQKSIRGSDPDAAVFYLMRFLEANDMVSPCRRLPAICCEDIGLADPNAIAHTMACIEAAERLGFPECAKPLAEAVIYLALAPKSASNEAAWMPAKKDIEAGYGVTVPDHISTEHHPRYVWPQDHPNHWTPQQYLPDDLVDRQYYQPQSDWEHERYGYWESVIANHPEMKNHT